MNVRMTQLPVWRIINIRSEEVRRNIGKAFRADTKSPGIYRALNRVRNSPTRVAATGLLAWMGVRLTDEMHIFAQLSRATPAGVLSGSAGDGQLRETGGRAKRGPRIKRSTSGAATCPSGIPQWCLQAQ